MLDHAANAGRHALADRKNDLYETPDVAVLALLGVEELPKGIWEPACGPGSIARVLRRSGRYVWASDLVNYASDDQDVCGWDFLNERAMPAGTEAVCTNPPYKLANEFVRHALEIGAPKVYMLLRLAFLESERRSGILDGGQLARVHIFRKRLPMMHRDGWSGPKASSSIPFAWFVWDRDHSGPTELRRLGWVSNDNAND